MATSSVHTYIMDLSRRRNTSIFDFCCKVPALIHPETINEVVNSLTGMNRARSMHTGAHEAADEI